MAKTLSRNKLRIKKHKKIRKYLQGSEEVPRICVFKSLSAFYVQAINDEIGHTLASNSTRALGIKNTVEGAKTLGQEFAKQLQSLGLKKVVFDRSGYIYHGKVAAFAQQLREAHFIK